jgi:hypothetical protein
MVNELWHSGAALSVEKLQSQMLASTPATLEMESIAMQSLSPFSTSAKFLRVFRV